MLGVLKRLHIFVGLFNMTSIAVFALVGITETFSGPDLAAPKTRVIDYEAPGGMSDRQMADDVVSRLQLPLIMPLQPGAIHRDRDNAIRIDFYSANGPGTITVFERQKKAGIERRRNALGEFLTEAHAASWFRSGPVLTMRLWALYVDCSIGSLLFMAVTGPWLWLTSRPRLAWARVAIAAGTALFAALWIATR